MDATKLIQVTSATGGSLCHAKQVMIALSAVLDRPCCTLQADMQASHNAEALKVSNNIELTRLHTLLSMQQSYIASNLHKP